MSTLLLQGVNTPDSVLDISPLTPKDRSDLEYMLKIGVDWVALSFVQQPADIVEILELIDKHLPDGAFRPAVMAKIEKPSCFFDDNLERIVDLCDGISKFDIELLCIRYISPSYLNVLTCSQWWHVVTWGLSVPPRMFPCYKNRLLIPVVCAGSLLWWPLKCWSR